jgi:N-acetyl sugar amidotransferase
MLTQKANTIHKEAAMSLNTYRICSNCIMDTTDSHITFDERGWCDYCNNYYTNILPNWHPDELGEKILGRVIDKIKQDGKGRDHDCLIGVSGGVDSSYVTYLSKAKFGLRPLIFHVDAGWNSQVAVNNIEKLIDGLGLDLHTEVVDWLEMKDLQLAFFKAQVPHIDTPQDHAFFAALYNFAAIHKFKYILTGANYSTECVREPLEWHYHASDLRQLKDIHRRFGQRPLRTFPTADIFKYKLYYRFIKGIRVVKPLNYVPYIKEDAILELSERFGWQKYAQKHHESRFTRFVECYWLPKKFGFERRKAHLSSLVLTLQTTRSEALLRVAKPEIDEQTMNQDFEYVAKKLNLTLEEFQKLFEGENKTYRDYKNSMNLINLGTKMMRIFGLEKRVVR